LEALAIEMCYGDHNLDEDKGSKIKLFDRIDVPSFPLLRNMSHEPKTNILNDTNSSVSSFSFRDSDKSGYVEDSKSASLFCTEFVKRNVVRLELYPKHDFVCYSIESSLNSLHSSSFLSFTIA